MRFGFKIILFVIIGFLVIIPFTFGISIPDIIKVFIINQQPLSPTVIINTTTTNVNNSDTLDNFDSLFFNPLNNTFFGSYVNLTTNITSRHADITDLISCDTIDTTSNGTLICGTDTSGAGLGWATPSALVVANNTANVAVGIGTNTPAPYNLSVIGDINGSWINGTNLNGTNTIYGNTGIFRTLTLRWGNLTAYSLDNAWSGKLVWANLTGYPSACSTSQTITTIGDTITCSAISITESQVSNLQSYVLNTSIIRLGTNSILGSNWVNSTNINATLLNASIVNASFVNSSVFIEGGTTLTGKYVSRNDWTTIDNYPTACSSQVVTGLADTLTCNSITNAYLSSGTFSAITGIGTLTTNLVMGSNSLTGGLYLNTTWVNATSGIFGGNITAYNWMNTTNFNSSSGLTINTNGLNATRNTTVYNTSTNDGFIIIGKGQRYCMDNSSCGKYMFYNGSHVIIQG